MSTLSVSTSLGTMRPKPSKTLANLANPCHRSAQLAQRAQHAQRLLFCPLESDSDCTCHFITHPLPLPSPLTSLRLFPLH